MGSSVKAQRWWIIVGLLSLPMATSAQVLTLGVGAEGKFYSGDGGGGNGGDDYTIRILPDAILGDDQGNLQWSLRYKPNYEWVVKDSETSGFTHLVNGELTWLINPATSVRVSDHFGFYESVVRYNETVPESEGDQVVEVTDTGSREDQSIRNTFSASLTHKLTPSQSLSFRLGHNLTEWDRPGRFDRQTLNAVGSYSHSVSVRNTLGAGVTYRRSSLEGGSDRATQSTDFYNLFASWNHSFDETFRFSVALGPTWVKGEDRDIATVAPDRLSYPVINAAGGRRLVRASSCPTEDGLRLLTGDCDVIDEDLVLLDLATFNLVNPWVEGVLSQWNPTRDLHLVGSVPSSSNESFTYFANIRLSKNWEQWSGSIGYTRQQSDSSGLGSSAIADILSGILAWRPSPRWRASLNASLTRQTSATKGIATVPVVESTNLFGNPPEGYLVPIQFSDVAQSVAIRAVEVEQSIEYLTFWTQLDVRYRVTKRTTLVGRVSYWNQSRDGIATGVGTEYDRYRVSFGVRYTFDPIRL